MNNLENTSRIKQYDKILVFLCAVYVVIPPYFKILGVSFPYICYILVICAGFLYHNFKLRIKNNKLTHVLLLWLVVNVFINCYHSYFFGAVWTFLLVAAGVVLANTITDKKVFISILLHVSYITGLVCVLGFVEAVFGFNIWSYLNNSGGYININPPRFGLIRIVSFAYQTISYGTFLVLVSCIIQYLLSINEIINEKQKRDLKVIYVLVVMNIILTLSRSVFLIYGISQVMILYGKGAKKLLRMMLKISIVGVVTLFILAIFVPSVFNAIMNVFYMMMALFDKDYTFLIANSFGTDNLNAVGTRLDIYKWTYESIAGKTWLGIGFKTPFSYIYNSGNIWNTMIEKNGIEVEYLLTFYETGYLGLILEVLVLLTILLDSFKKRKKSTDWEGKVGFNYIMLVVIACMIAQYFMVNQSSEQYLFFLIIGLYLSYNNRQFSSITDVQGAGGKI